MKRTLITLLHALVAWGLCGAVMGIGLSLWSVQTALIGHLIAAPIIAVFVSLVYFKKFAYTTPLQAACIFVGFIIVMDVFVVALLIENSFEMFTDPMGTWIPFALIFLATYIVGRTVLKPAKPESHHAPSHDSN